MPPQAGIRKLSKENMPHLECLPTCTVLGLVAEPWGVTTHAVRVIVFSCDNILLHILLRSRVAQAQASYVAGSPVPLPLPPAPVLIVTLGPIRALVPLFR